MAHGAVILFTLAFGCSAPLYLTLFLYVKLGFEPLENLYTIGSPSCFA